MGNQCAALMKINLSIVPVCRQYHNHEQQPQFGSMRVIIALQPTYNPLCLDMPLFVHYNHTCFWFCYYLLHKIAARLTSKTKFDFLSHPILSVTTTRRNQTCNQLAQESTNSGDTSFLLYVVHCMSSLLLYASFLQLD